MVGLDKVGREGVSEEGWEGPGVDTLVAGTLLVGADERGQLGVDDGYTDSMFGLAVGGCKKLVTGSPVGGMLGAAETDIAGDSVEPSLGFSVATLLPLIESSRPSLELLAATVSTVFDDSRSSVEL